MADVLASAPGWLWSARHRRNRTWRFLKFTNVVPFLPWSRWDEFVGGFTCAVGRPLLNKRFASQYEERGRRGRDDTRHGCSTARPSGVWQHPVRMLSAVVRAGLDIRRHRIEPRFPRV